MYYATFPTDFGWTAAVYSCKPFQLRKVYLPHGTRKALMSSVEADFKISDGHNSNIDIFIESMQQYFKGKPIQVPSSWLNWDTLTPLQRETLKQAAQIPFGAVCTYQQLAKRINRPKASRFVGSCMARNPYPIIIPCHRVIRSDGTVGQFAGGTALKERLLEMEKAKS
ncbi:methylated-DNA-[protein]-cysteine S-methyltransferase [Candidatus Magnetomorum sp. HK-1]|nr:methylated-DNA-[protein]-cysteine S-methyltransferase [Candidatus Magnetomorum sp. HK-1]